MFQKNDYVLFNTYGLSNIRGVIVDLHYSENKKTNETFVSLKAIVHYKGEYSLFSFIEVKREDEVKKSEHLIQRQAF